MIAVKSTGISKQSVITDNGSMVMHVMEEIFIYYF